MLKKPYLIAEIGINHNGDIKIAKELINNAVIAGLMQSNSKRELI